MSQRRQPQLDSGMDDGVDVAMVGNQLGHDFPGCGCKRTGHYQAGAIHAPGS